MKESADSLSPISRTSENTLQPAKADQIQMVYVWTYSDTVARTTYSDPINPAGKKSKMNVVSCE